MIWVLLYLHIGTWLLAVETRRLENKYLRAWTFPVYALLALWIWPLLVITTRRRRVAWY